MKDKKVIVVSIVIGVLCILLILFGVYASNQKSKGPAKKPNPTPEIHYDKAPDGTKVNNSEMFNISRSFDGFYFENINLAQYQNETVFEADCTNQTGKDQEAFKVALIMLDENGKEGNQITLYIQGTKAGETTHVYTATTRNIVNAYDFKIKRTY